MTRTRFSIGIDLGTTNCALAFVALDGRAETEVLGIRQWDTVTTLAEAPTLPSFLYLPEAAVAAQIPGRNANTAAGTWIAGRLARRQAALGPGRVVQSAKSWLCHHATDRTQPFLPWGSDELGPDEKISPVRACALLLNTLRGSWNDRFAAAGTDFSFDAQDITVTVPASFDTVAQRLTLSAAAEAGFPATVRLLEEPQAAFYRWLERHDAVEQLWRRLPDAAVAAHHALVIDIGGGTSDFSLFAIAPRGSADGAAIKRIAVSDHILLGGDNIDLALAHLIEPRLSSDGARLSAAQWAHLVARCRELKETALAGEGRPDDAFPFSVPARGSGLIEGTLSARVERAEIEAVILDGFFPACAASDRPRKALGALKEWGLPFAADSAVTRHLAAFLKDQPRIDVLLFNGGALSPPAVRRRLSETIASWQDGHAPLVLDNDEPHLAVARGAARYGKIMRDKTLRIEADAARAIFLAAHSRPADDTPTPATPLQAAPSLVCVLPHGAAPEETFAIDGLGLEVRLNRPVRFASYESTHRAGCKAGDVVAWNDADFHPLPPLETVVRLADAGRAKPPRGTLAVTLKAKLSELGVLQVSCVSADPRRPQSWPLEFDLRAPAPAAVADGPPPLAPNASADALQAARERIEAVFRRTAGAKTKITAARVLTGLEAALSMPKGAWNAGLVRALWPAVEACMDSRAASVEHEEAWLLLAGYLLRPGFGVAFDEERIDSLWRVRTRGLCFAGKRTRIQEYVLWRRVAGGLSRERQERVLAAEQATLDRQGNPPPELILLAGAFERVGHDIKAHLIERFIAAGREHARAGTHSTPYFAALGLLLNRMPLYAGPEAVVSADLVERAYEAFSGLDWAAPELAELQTLFLRAARVTGNRSLDLPKSLCSKIAGKLEKCGVAPLRTARLRAFVPMQRAEQAGLFGELLPPGLVLTKANGADG